MWNFERNFVNAKFCFMQQGLSYDVICSLGIVAIQNQSSTLVIYNYFTFRNRFLERLSSSVGSLDVEV